MMSQILEKLLEERSHGLKGGLFHKTQVKLTYNTNRIEGSKLTEEQTRYIFETKTVGFNADGLPVDDIIETSNHFRCFDYLLNTIEQPLNVGIIKEFHKILKNGTSDSHKSYFNVGAWKKIPNEVGNVETSQPENVDEDMNSLLESYLANYIVTLDEIIAFHYQFETIHPFQDGNGRVGRLIMFRECLKHDIVPFIIDKDMKLFYYRGLSEFKMDQAYLRNTCLASQDTYRVWVNYFYPEIDVSDE